MDPLNPIYQEPVFRPPPARNIELTRVDRDPQEHAAPQDDADEDERHGADDDERDVQIDAGAAPAHPDKHPHIDIDA